MEQLQHSNQGNTSFAEKQLNRFVRTVNPTFRQENPYVYKLDSDVSKIVRDAFNKEIKKTTRTFTFRGANFTLNREQVKIAKFVFSNTDRNNTMVGCFDNIIKNTKNKPKRNFVNELYAFIKFAGLAYSPILNNTSLNSKFEFNNEIVRYFFLYIANSIMKKSKNLPRTKEDNKALDLSNYFFRNFRSHKAFNPSGSFGTQNLDIEMDKYLGDASKIRLLISTNQARNYYNYSRIIQNIYLYIKDSNHNDDKMIGQLLGLSLVVKLDLALKKSKKSRLNAYSTLTEDRYNQLSLYYSFLLNEFVKYSQQKEKNFAFIFSVLTESENKVWLKDEPRMSKSAIIALVFNYLFMIIWAIIILYPLALLLKLTFNADATSSLNTAGFTFTTFNYEFLFNDTFFWDWTANTFIVAFSTAFVVTIFCSLLAYAYSRFDFKGKKASIGSVMIFQMIPAGLALVVFIVYGKFFTDELAIENAHLLILIVIYSGGAIAGNTFLLKGYMDTISADVFDAARIDGCSHMKVFWTIAIPLAKPMMSVIFLWSFVGPFFDFLLPTILSGNNEQQLTMAAGLNTLITDNRAGGGNFSPGAYAAGGVLVAVPFAVLFLGLNKQIVNGLTAGAVK